MNKKMTLDSNKNSLNTPNLMLNLDSLESTTMLKRFKEFSVKTETMLPSNNQSKSKVMLLKTYVLKLTEITSHYKTETI
jgi:hypothetical protein